MKHANKVFWTVLASLLFMGLGVLIPIAIVLGICCGVGIDSLEAKLKAIGEGYRRRKAGTPAEPIVVDSDDSGIDELLQIHDDVEREALAYKIGAYSDAFDRMRKSKTN